MACTVLKSAGFMTSSGTVAQLQVRQQMSGVITEILQNVKPIL
jgi:hypothetical protein